MEEGLGTLQTAGCTAARRDRMAQHNTLHSTSGILNLEDHYSWQVAHNLRERPKLDPFNDSGMSLEYDSSDAGLELDRVSSSATQSARRTPSPSSILRLQEAQPQEPQPLNPPGFTLPSFSAAFGMPNVSNVHILSAMRESGAFLRSTEAISARSVEAPSGLESVLQRPPVSSNVLQADSSAPARLQLDSDPSRTPLHQIPGPDTIISNKDTCRRDSICPSSAGSSVVSRRDALTYLTSESPYSSDDARLSSEDGASRLELLHTKHLVLASLMREVHALFDPEWKADTRTCTQNGTGSSSGQTPSTNIQLCGSVNSHKRKHDDLDPEPPGDGEGGKRQKRRSKEPFGNNPNGLYACPFNKFDPQRYSVNDITGTKYRTCWRPDFVSIARLRYV